ncbi:hypothetical protein EST38_g9155 [Candolleomyces aberdarensis]|uniref:Uncharacterized protein n=1 Tax=Candolleomyces aberdarensis TaxID=2316362 RepID=A0A4Q2DCF0_9AGAR|nr:hypothetical protein EST38_g9155 [Candolleomyces aberdarensis]
MLMNHNAEANYEIALHLIPGTNCGVYNLPTNNEYTFILPGVGNTEPRDIVLRLHGGLLEQISDLNPAYVTLQYPLLLPFGTLEWHPELQLIETERQRERQFNNWHRNIAQREEAGLEGEEVEQD